MAGIIASKTGFYLVYVLLFTVALIYVSKFTQLEATYAVKLETVEDSIVANRIVKCLSEEGNFGAMEESKLEVKGLKDCFGNGYGLRIKVVKSRESGGKPKIVEWGDVSVLREIKRYVLVDGMGSRLEIGYNKDVA